MGTPGSAISHKRVNGDYRDSLKTYWPDLLIYVVLLAAGMLGDFTSCTLTRLPPFWARMLLQLDYLAVVFAGVRFGVAAGLAASAVAGVLHVGITLAFGQVASGIDGLAMLAPLGLLAGWAGRGRATVLLDGETVIPGTLERNRTGSMLELARLMPEVADQFRTPIASIQGAAFLLEDPDLAQDKRQEFAGILRKECRHIELLVELLDFTQVRLLAQEDVDLRRLIDDVIAQSAPSHESGITVKNLASRDLPSLRCERELIKHALEIVTGDAIRALPHYGEVALSAHVAQGEMLVRVELRADNLSVPLNTVLTRTLGKSDLGIVRHLTERHGGSVHVEPGASGSASICIILPLRQGQAHGRRQNTGR